MSDNIGTIQIGKTHNIGTVQVGATHEIGAVALPVAVAASGAPDFAGVQRYEWSADLLSLSNGDPVATWPDAGGSGIDVSQATASKRPVYRASVGGFPAIEFDGVDDVLEATGLSLDWSSGYTIFVVFQAKNFDAADGLFVADGGANSSSDDRIQIYWNSSSAGPPVLHNIDVIRRSTSLAAFESAPVFEVGADNMLTSTVDGGTADEHYDGRSALTRTAGTGLQAPALTFSRIAVGVGYFHETLDGYIRHLVVYDSKLSSVQRESVWDNLEGRSGGPF